MYNIIFIGLIIFIPFIVFMIYVTVKHARYRAEVATLFALDVAASKLHYCDKTLGLNELMNKNRKEIIECLKEKDDDGMTPLHRAAKDISDAEIIHCMIVLKADVNAKDSHGMTPLHWAAACNPNVDVAKCLVAHGANIRAENDQGVTPLDLSLKFAKSEDVGLYFLDLMMGTKGMEVTDPKRLTEIKQRFVWNKTIHNANNNEN